MEENTSCNQKRKASKEIMKSIKNLHQFIDERTEQLEEDGFCIVINASYLNEDGTRKCVMAIQGKLKDVFDTLAANMRSSEDFKSVAGKAYLASLLRGE